MKSVYLLEKNINYVYIMCCFGIAVWSFFITSLPLIMKISKSKSYILSIFGAGLVLGTAFSVIIPESLEPACLSHDGHNVDSTVKEFTFQQLGLSMSLGFLCMVLFESISHRYHHHSHENHDKSFELLLEDNKKSAMTVQQHTITTKVYGLALHSLFDGISLASSYLSNNINTIQVLFAAMIFHKTSSSFGIGTFLKSSNLNFHESFWYLLLISCSTPLSALLSAFLATWQVNLISSAYIPLLFAFSSGTFVHVAVSHLMTDFGEQLTIIQMIVLTIGIIIPYFFFVEH